MDMQASTKNWLTAEELVSFGAELDQLRQAALDDLGERDAKHIYAIIRKQKQCEILGRGLIHFGLSPVGWGLGVGMLTVSKILENMEIGHNVMHGQYDWMNDPELQSQSYEWDTVCDGDSWRKTHNYEHHTFTNIIGKDRDYGYGLLRLSDDEPWKPWHLLQFMNYAALSVMFQWGVALNELEIDLIKSGKVTLREKVPFLKRFAKKSAQQLTKDYVVFPLLAGPFALKVIAGNGLANLGRNLWTSTIIFCGHFTENAQTFSIEETENESRGAWYYRQLLGSSNFTGGKWLHIMSGHLSYQIEHHMFPDIPAHRYPEMADKVQELCKRYSIPYNTGSFAQQYKTVLKRIARHSLPTDAYQRVLSTLKQFDPRGAVHETS